EALGRQSPEFVIDERQQLPGGVRVAAGDGVEDAGHRAHGPYDNRSGGGRKESGRPYAGPPQGEVAGRLPRRVAGKADTGAGRKDQQADTAWGHETMGATGRAPLLANRR